METLLGHLGITRRSPLLRPARWLLRSPFILRRRLQRLRGPASQAEAAPLVLSAPEKAADYVRYRSASITLCEEVFDKVLAVSDRTRTVLVARGVPAHQIAVSPIGSAEAARFRTTRRITAARPGGLQIGFLG
jgi:hypothetical protein